MDLRYFSEVMYRFLNLYIFYPYFQIIAMCFLTFMPNFGIIVGGIKEKDL